MTATNATRKIFENAQILGFEVLMQHDVMLVYFRTADGKKLHAVASAFCDNVRSFMKDADGSAITCTITTSADTVEIDGKHHWVMYSPCKPSDEGRAKYEAWKARRQATLAVETAPLTEEELAIRNLMFGKPSKPAEEPAMALADLL